MRRLPILVAALAVSVALSPFPVFATRTVTLPLAVHVEDARRGEVPEWLRRANVYYAPAGVRFQVSHTRPLPAGARHLADNRARHRLARRLVRRAINVFFVDAIVDRWPSRATARAAARVGRRPSGRLGGAHIRKPDRRPKSYVIVLAYPERPGATAVGLAHELGHVLGAPHHADPDNVMSYGPARRGFDASQRRMFRRRAQRLLRAGDVRRVRRSPDR